MVSNSEPEYSEMINVVSQMRQVEPSLSTAERRVADAVRAGYEAATRLTIADLATQAGVSRPTVTRFCRSVGCKSFRDFKIRLASTLTVAAAYLRSDRVSLDGTGQMVMLRAANAVRDCLSQLHFPVLETALEAVSRAQRIDIYGQGGGPTSIVEDAKLRLFRLGIPGLSM